MGQGGILYWLSLPATAVKQLYHTRHITGQARQQWIYLSSIVVKGEIEVSPWEINAVHAGIQGYGIPPGPLPISKQTVVPVHVLRGFQGIGQTEQIVLLRQLAGAGAPEVIQLAGQRCINTQLTSLILAGSR